MREKVAAAQPRIREPESVKPSTDDLQRRIAEAAYFRAQSRGFQPGGETQDWLAAEAEILARTRDSAGLI
jgi:hypothetical protein